MRFDSVRILLIVWNQLRISSFLTLLHVKVKTCILADLLEHLPVVVFLAHHHCLQLLRLEEVHHIDVTHLEEPSLELTEHSLHRLVEGIVDKGGYELFPMK